MKKIIYVPNKIAQNSIINGTIFSYNFNSINDIKWTSKLLIQEKCILTGCDSNQQDLLPIFYSWYKKFNNYPIVFVDYGMNDYYKKWCSEKGLLIKINIPSLDIKKWFWKPFSILCCNYRNILWLDLDCQVKNNLSELFNYLNNEKKFGICKDNKNVEPIGKSIYANSGVIVTEFGNNLIIDWCKEIFNNFNSYRGDQESLYWGKVLDKHYDKIIMIDNKYNNHNRKDDGENAIIKHWICNSGKNTFKSIGENKGK